MPNGRGLQTCLVLFFSSASAVSVLNTTTEVPTVAPSGSTFLTPVLYKSGEETTVNPVALEATEPSRSDDEPNNSPQVVPPGKDSPKTIRLLPANPTSPHNVQTQQHTGGWRRIRMASSLPLIDVQSQMYNFTVTFRPEMDRADEDEDIKILMNNLDPVEDEERASSGSGGHHGAEHCGGEFRQLGDVILSPGYPLYYPNNAKCIYNIQLPPDSNLTIKFTCEDFRLQGGQVKRVLINSLGWPILKVVLRRTTKAAEAKRNCFCR